MSLFRGLALWLCRQNIQIDDDRRDWLITPIGGLPLVVWLGLLTVGLSWLFLSATIWGRENYALGSNPAAAHRVGIHRSRVWLRAFTVQGLLAGCAGLFFLAYTGNLQPANTPDRTLDAIAAAVVGGVAITGGRGSVLGAALGCLFLVSLPKVCAYLEVSTAWQQTLTGAVMVAAISVDRLWRRGGQG
jgi:rhamnose transport system permease protein